MLAVVSCLKRAGESDGGLQVLDLCTAEGNANQAQEDSSNMQRVFFYGSSECHSLLDSIKSMIVPTRAGIITN